MVHNKVIVVAKRSAWEQYHSDPLDYGEMGTDAARRAKDSHDRHHASLNSVMSVLKQLKMRPWLIEGAETGFDPGDSSLVITVGGDGTLLSASHHMPSVTPLLGINSDPVFSKGHFCLLTADTKLRDNLERVLDPNACPLKKVTRMRVKVNERVVADRILNEALYSHTCPAAMTRLMLTTGELDEAYTRYACSGVWIGTGAGTTGAISSAGGFRFNPDVRMLEAVVREPWNPPKVGNEVYSRHSFTLISKTVDSTLYLDGPFLRVPVGFDQEVKFEVSEQHLTLVA